MNFTGSRDEVAIRLEPVVSVRQKVRVGVEAIPEGPDGASPRSLLHHARTQGQTLELDRWLRQKALDTFRPVQDAEKDALLFFPFESSVVDLGVVGSGHLRQQVDQLGLNPHQLVIEISPSQAEDAKALGRFIDNYRSQGFLIALHQVGSGHSNLTRWPLARPDIIKISAALVSRLHDNYFQQEIFRTLASLSRKLGALTVAEGVSDMKEALAALELGADMLQGSLFSNEPQQLKEVLIQLGAQYKSHLTDKAREERARTQAMESVLTQWQKNLQTQPQENFEKRLEETLRETPGVECAWILNDAGQQITETVRSPRCVFKHNALFRPAERGADHSMKDYFYLLNDPFVGRYTTEPYVSLASGNLCRTLSGLIKDQKNQTFVLCLDVPLSSTTL